jgi:FemAB-related protein (PEP-CTERM system-associated)
MITVRQIGKEQAALWDECVRSTPSSTYFHLFGWSEVIRKSYGLSTVFLGAFDGERLIGILPAVRSGESKAVSLAFGTYGGWIFSPGVQTGEGEKKLMEHLSANGIHLLENRLVGNEGGAQIGEFVTQRVSLPPSSEQLWNSLDAKVRNQVRKAQKAGLVARWGGDQLTDFYAIYSKNMRHLGTPPHPRKFFEAVAAEFGEAIRILTIRLQEKTLAAMLLMSFGRQLSDPWAASLREYAALCPNMLMYWEALKLGCENGYDEFDLGRSTIGSGPFKFKSQWGASLVPLTYEAVTLNRNGDLERRIPSSSKLLPLLSWLWRLVPLFVTLRLGPLLRKRLA